MDASFRLTRPEDLQLAIAPQQGLHRRFGPTQSAPSTSIGDWIDTLPKQLAANELQTGYAIIWCVVSDEGRTVAVALGGHVIKTGCAPYLIDWIEGGLIKAASP